MIFSSPATPPNSHRVQPTPSHMEIIPHDHYGDAVNVVSDHYGINDVHPAADDTLYREQKYAPKSQSKEKRSMGEPDPIPPYGQFDMPHQTYMVLAVVVSACFNLPIGLLALLVSVKSQNSFKEGNLDSGRAKARCSLVLSMTGIVVTVAVVMGVVFYIASKHKEINKYYG